jgi:hypothetical protein
MKYSHLRQIVKEEILKEFNKSQLDFIALKLNTVRTLDFEKVLNALDAKGIKYPELKEKIAKGEIKTLKDLEILRGTPKRIKAGKINKGEIDANLIYNQDNLRVYLGKDKKSCIKYGTGYSFCISTRGSRNYYDQYREENGTPYFIFDDNKTSEKDNDDEFIDPTHLLVVFADIDSTYTVTQADNNDDGKWYRSFNELVSSYPRLSKLKNILQYMD